MVVKQKETKPKNEIYFFLSQTFSFLFFKIKQQTTILLYPLLNLT